jgi:hypothetical protein
VKIQPQWVVTPGKQTNNKQLQEMFQAELVYLNEIIFRPPKTSLNAKLDKKNERLVDLN